jgi:hypothetical protein
LAEPYKAYNLHIWKTTTCIFHGFQSIASKNESKSLRIQTLYPKKTEKTWGTHSIEIIFMSSKGPIEYKAATAKTTSKLCQILSVQHQNQHESIQFGLCCESQINPAKECQYQSFSNSMGHKIQPWDLGQLLRRFSTWFLVMCTLTNHSEALKPSAASLLNLPF